MPRDLKILTAVSQPAVGRKFIWILRIYKAITKGGNDESGEYSLGHQVIDSEEQGKEF